MQTDQKKKEMETGFSSKEKSNAFVVSAQKIFVLNTV